MRNDGGEAESERSMSRVMRKGNYVDRNRCSDERFSGLGNLEKNRIQAVVASWQFDRRGTAAY